MLIPWPDSGTEWTVDVRALMGRQIPEVDQSPEERAVRSLVSRIAQRSERDREALHFARSEHDFPVMPGQTSTVYKRFAELCRRPWGRLIVEALTERSRVVKIESSTGFDFETVWERDNLNQLQHSQWHAAAECGSTAWMVWPESDAPDAPVRISTEPGGAVAVDYDAWGQPVRAIKLSADEDRRHGAWRCDEFTADVWRVWQFDGQTLERVSTEPNRVGVVPIVEAPWGHGKPELHDLVSPLKSIERTALEGHVAAHVAAYPQRWASGIERYLRDGDDNFVLDANGKPIELPTPWQGAVDAVFTADSPDSEFGAFPTVDMRMYIAQVESDVSHVGVLSRVPANYLSVSGLNLPNADSLAAAHDPFVAKIETQEVRFGLAVERLAQTYAAAVGEDAGQVTTTWAPLVPMSEQSRADSVLKWSQIGASAPMAWVLRRAGVPEPDIAEFARDLVQEDLLRPGPDVDVAVQTAVDMVTAQPTMIAMGELTIADVVQQLRDAGYGSG